MSSPTGPAEPSPACRPAPAGARVLQLLLGVAYGAHAGEGLHAYDPLGVMESVAQLRQWLATRVEP